MPRKKLHPIFGASDLARPLPRRKREGLLGPPITKEDWKSEFQRRFFLLLQHYRLDPKSDDLWTRLAFCLAMDFVPGLREESYIRRGRPNKKWSSESVSARREVLGEYDRIRERNGSLSDYRICELIAGQWKKKSTSSLSGKSARTIYRELRLAQTEAFQRSGSFDIIFRQLVPPRPGLAATILTAKPEWSPRGFGRLGNDSPTPPELQDALDRLTPIGNRQQKE